ncbi:hypothetical protein CLOM_g5959 [Closterium sp. NIES-68]|nr:hypothetical protein CLOM_g5959 [Closterium sp. NIES-68]GJP85818.1 hypothetical protein CLOP_g15915 [Closterium sp. NIES-67]
MVANSLSLSTWQQARWMLPLRPSTQADIAAARAEACTCTARRSPTGRPASATPSRVGLVQPAAWRGMNLSLRAHRRATRATRGSAARPTAASAAADAAAASGQAAGDVALSISTFNILAPIYKRLAGEAVRESAFREEWVARNERILAALRAVDSTVVCLQEFWFNADLERMYHDALEEHGYQLFKLPRTNARGDGLVTAVRGGQGVSVADYEPILFNDCGDRVAQLLRLRVRGGEMLLVNTHLLFPHNANSSLIRLREVYKVLEYLEQYRQRHGLPALPIVLCGDLNGTKTGRVYRFLRSQGFVSCYDTAKQHADNDACWVSHRNHHGALVGVDYIWLLNPSAQDEPLTADWKAAIFQMIKAKLGEAGMEEERQAFDFFRSDSEAGAQGQGEVPEHVTAEQFKYAMDQLGLTGEGTVGLTRVEIEELVQCVDTDGNGVIDYDEFKSLLLAPSMEETYARIKEATGIVELPWPSNPAASATSPAPTPFTVQPDTSSAPDLLVCEAQLVPDPMARGVWPDDYSISDHAILTAAFTAAGTHA